MNEKYKIQKFAHRAAELFNNNKKLDGTEVTYLKNNLPNNIQSEKFDLFLNAISDGIINYNEYKKITHIEHVMLYQRYDFHDFVARKPRRTNLKTHRKPRRTNL